ncbi:hypothetical protein PGT21_020331 [Puccinia graminis f. sp. tritici]|uniref:Uncharacterized protein n=1 Tax=Puccinia graminis f. sp. tritici TaxID=56615 RepID=A0A5B0Q651_PUCGR|nr:hypothetical protein PGT21_020331 [Puccinia graminis f. sp. tritici]
MHIGRPRSVSGRESSRLLHKRPIAFQKSVERSVNTARSRSAGAVSVAKEIVELL